MDLNHVSMDVHDLFCILTYVYYFVLLGNYSLRSLGTPLLYSAVYDATKKIPNPDDQDMAKKTVYDKWLASFPDTAQGLPRY